jgi:hypothetical protein
MIDVPEMIRSGLMRERALAFLIPARTAVLYRGIVLKEQTAGRWRMLGCERERISDPTAAKNLLIVGRVDQPSPDTSPMARFCHLPFTLPIE